MRRCNDCSYWPLRDDWDYCPCCGKKQEFKRKKYGKLEIPHRRCSFCNTCPVCHTGPFYNYYATQKHMRREHRKDCWEHRCSYSTCPECICDKGNGRSYTPCTCHLKEDNRMIVDPCVCRESVMIDILDVPPSMTYTHIFDYYKLNSFGIRWSQLDWEVKRPRIAAFKYEGIWRLIEDSLREWFGEVNPEILQIPPNGKIPRRGVI